MATFVDDAVVEATDSDPLIDCFRQPENQSSRNPKLV
jgi:hypothetical protein